MTRPTEDRITTEKTIIISNIKTKKDERRNTRVVNSTTISGTRQERYHFLVVSHPLLLFLSGRINSNPKCRFSVGDVPLGVMYESLSTCPPVSLCVLTTLSYETKTKRGLVVPVLPLKY